MDAYRARRARPHEVGEAALDLIPAPDEADLPLESWAVAAALKGATDYAHVVITLVTASFLTDSGNAVGIPPRTVKSRTPYALRALKLALEERGLCHDRPACVTSVSRSHLRGRRDRSRRAHAVDIHLGTCPDCREELAGLAGLLPCPAGCPPATPSG